MVLKPLPVDHTRIPAAWSDRFSSPALEAVAGPDGEMDRCSLLFFLSHLDAREAGDAVHVEPAGRKEASGDGDRLDRLVDRPRADHLDFCGPAVSDAIGDGSGRRRRIRVRGHLEHLSRVDRPPPEPTWRSQ